jgi:hypothetical protein
MAMMFTFAFGTPLDTQYHTRSSFNSWVFHRSPSILSRHYFLLDDRQNDRSWNQENAVSKSVNIASYRKRELDLQVNISVSGNLDLASGKYAAFQTA